MGVSAEIIDLRVLRPLCPSRIVESVKKTSRLVTVEEQPVLGGWGSSIIAEVVEQCFDYLDAPPVRIGLPEYPTPYSPPLEDNAIPDHTDIEDKVRSLLSREKKW